MCQQGNDKRREKNYGDLKLEYGRSPEKVTEERRRTVFENDYVIVKCKSSRLWITSLYIRREKQVNLQNCF